MSRIECIKIAILFLLNFSSVFIVNADEPGKVMQTPWTEKVDKQLPLNNYPRPAMERNNWQNLNGQWDFCIQTANAGIPAKWEGQILVPYPVESYLSGVQRKVSKDEALWYRKNIAIPKLNNEKRVILHFGAIDWEAEIFINGKQVFTHQGGYTSFSIDITPYINKGVAKLVVKVTDPTDDGQQPRGKQVKNPGGIYYTSVTGIWQTVWYEIVPNTYLSSFKLTTNIKSSVVSIKPEIENSLGNDKLRIAVSLNSKLVAEKVFENTENIKLQIPGAKLWSPENPVLYDVQISVLRNNAIIDQVKGYFGLREISIAKDEKGISRLCLNNKPLFQYGPLDQGFWPDGIYTAPTDEAMLWDIQAMKDMGFNMVRKHVKVEPSRWYYYCDKVGLIVWQDMPSGYGEIVPVKDHDHSIENDWLAKNYSDYTRSVGSEANFCKEWKDIVEQLYNFPSVCVWVPFNESWGQFKTNSLIEWTKQIDTTRLIDGPSGWIDRGEGDMRDYHLYGNRLKELPLENERPLVIGEFGGLGFPVEGHMYSKETWSYQGFKNTGELIDAYTKLIDKIIRLKEYGYAAAVYTQLTDVETEINGLITYDRKEFKISKETLKNINNKLYSK